MSSPVTTPEQRPIRPPARFFDARLLILVPALMWAGNAIVARATTGEVPPIGLAFWRWTIAALVILPFAWPHLRSDAAEIRKHSVIMVVLSALGIAYFNAALYLSAATTTALNILMLQTAMPVLIVLAMFVIFRVTVTPLQGVGILLSLAGALTLVMHGDISVLTSLAFNVGDLWMLSATLGYAIYTALLRLRPDVHGLSFLFATCAIGAGLLLPLYLVETFTVQPVPLSLNAVLAIGYVAIFASAVGYFAYNRSVELLGASTAGLTSYLVPVYGTILAILLLGERPEPYHLVGIVLIAAGIVLAVRKQQA